jgi:hypothetical protein
MKTIKAAVITTTKKVVTMAKTVAEEVKAAVVPLWTNQSPKQNHKPKANHSIRLKKMIRTVKGTTTNRQVKNLTKHRLSPPLKKNQTRQKIELRYLKTRSNQKWSTFSSLSQSKVMKKMNGRKLMAKRPQNLLTW